MASITSRKGARRMSEVPADVQRLLNSGQIEAINLVESLVVDHWVLAQAVLPKLGLKGALPEIERRFALMDRVTIMPAIREVSASVVAHVGDGKACQQVAKQLFEQPSDSVRCWGAYVVGYAPGLSQRTRLTNIRPFAADAHYGVREVAWIAVREPLAEKLLPAIELLQPWTGHANDNLRRFASEVTRPRGVWCRHIQALKDEPWLAEMLLEPLKADKSKYVRDSVANWLNDASKSQPDWVKQLCRGWQKTSPTPETAYIVKRALRTIRGKRV
jgi:3-methyladenine DNA glycosylase AlkC